MSQRGFFEEHIRLLKLMRKQKKKKKLLTSETMKNKLKLKKKKKKKSSAVNDETTEETRKGKHCRDLRHYRRLAESHERDGEWWSNICRAAASGSGGDGGYELDPDRLEQFKRVDKGGVCYFPVLDDEYHKYIVESNNFKRYATSCVESGGGFDIDWAVGVPCLSINHEPLCIEGTPLLPKLAERALQKYNSTHETGDYELVGLVKANRSCRGPFDVNYITFLAAKKSSSTVEDVKKEADTFRAKVCNISLADPLFRGCVSSVCITPSSSV